MNAGGFMKVWGGMRLGRKSTLVDKVGELADRSGRGKKSANGIARRDS
jgi:hypothetical protein